MESKIYIFPITPQPAPRMTQRDRWIKTRMERTNRYFQYRDDLQKLALFNKFIPSESMRLVFYFPLTKSTKAKDGDPHQYRPDLDNLIKSFKDTFFEDDSVVWHLDAYKYWTSEKIGRIEIINL